MTKGIKKLSEGQSYTDSLGAWGNYKYYRYYKSCDDCDLKINVHAFDNQMAMVNVNYGRAHQLPLENDESVDYSKNIYGSGSLEIEGQPSGKPGSQGLYTIGVHAHGNMTYSISVQ